VYLSAALERSPPSADGGGADDAADADAVYPGAAYALAFVADAAAVGVNVPEVPPSKPLPK
jgi:hypothetical protein